MKLILVKYRTIYKLKCKKSEKIILKEISIKKKRMNKNDLTIILVIMILVGLVGNAINLIVLSRKSMRKITTFRLLLFLSLIDFLVLSTCATDTLLSYGYLVDFRVHSIYICRIHTFLTYFLTHTSSIILTLISVERVLVVYDFDMMKFSRIRSQYNPKLKLTNDYRNPKKIKHVFRSSSIENLEYKHENRCIRFLHLYRIDFLVLLIMFIVLLINTHFLFYLNLIDVRMIFETDNLHSFGKNMTNIYYSIMNQTETFCAPVLNSKYEYFLKNIWTWLDMFLYSFIPFIIMIISSLVILFKINKSTSLFINSVVNKNNSFNKSITKKRLKKNKQMSLMLFLTNVYFAVCTIPFFIMYKLDRGQNFDENGKSAYESLFAFVHILSYSNNSINFLFFGIFSHKYRNELFTVFRLK
jgi:hypothetical protein